MSLKGEILKEKRKVYKKGKKSYSWFTRKAMKHAVFVASVYFVNRKMITDKIGAINNLA